MKRQGKKKKTWPIALAAIVAWIVIIPLSAFITFFYGYQFIFELIFPATYEFSDPARYEQEDYMWPQSLEGYTVNAYLHKKYNGLGYSDERFLDLTVSEEQLADLLERARDAKIVWEREAYYAEGYYEIVYRDHYSIFEGETTDVQLIGYAMISKVIYNPETNNIVYVDIYVNADPNLPLNEMAYFNRFDIDEYEYVEYTPW